MALMFVAGFGVLAIIFWFDWKEAKRKAQKKAKKKEKKRLKTLAAT